MYFCIDDKPSIVAVFDEPTAAEAFADQWFYGRGVDWDAVAEAGDEEAPESPFLAGFYGSGIEIYSSEQWDDRLSESIDCYLEDNIEKMLRHPLLRAVKGEKVSREVRLALGELTTWELVCMLTIIYTLSESGFYDDLTGEPDYQAIRWRIYDCINLGRYRLLHKLEEKLSFYLSYPII